MIDLELTAEQLLAYETAQRLAKQVAPDPRVTWADAGEFSWAFLELLAQHGLTGVALPEAQGGQGLTLIDAVLVIMAVGSVAPHLADVVHSTNFGAIQQISAFANDTVVDEVLREMLGGRALASIAMSEPGAGSAVSSLRTRAEVRGKDVHVTGQKVFNTNGPYATHYVVWARFREGKDGIGAVIVPADASGFSRGKTERFISGEPYCSLYFDDAAVPSSYVLLDRDGLRRMISVFNVERLGNASRSVALGELALRLATDYVLNRETGGTRLADHQGLQWMLADARMQLDASKLLIYRAATEMKDGQLDPLNVAVAKCFANEAGFKAADTALQLFGGYGYTTDYPIEYLWKRTRGWLIAGGSTQILRNRIASELLKRHIRGSRSA